MPETIDWPLSPKSQMDGRRKWLAAVVVALVILLLLARSAISYWVDLEWHSSLGYSAVFWTTQKIEWAVFGTFFAATFCILFGALALLRRGHHADLPGSQTIFVGGQPLTLAVGKVMRVGALVGALVVALLSGLTMLAEWPTFALWLFGPKSAGPADPVFGKPLSFYLFTLPAVDLVTGWLLILSLLLCGIAAFFLLVVGGGRLMRRTELTGAPWRGLSLSAAFALAVLAVRVYFARYAHLSAHHTIFDGITYTDAHITLPGMLLIAAALGVGALIALVNGATRARLNWLAASVVPAIACYVVMGVSAWYVTSFIVKPNELVREQPYIANNIVQTRTAFGLDRFRLSEFPAETTVEATDPANNRATLENIRLWDWQALQDTLRQIQEIRTYYDFPDIDIDRYQLGGSTRQVMLAARELNVDKLPESGRNWINEKLIYTHGYGITMNPVNGFTEEGLPTLMMSNMPVQSTLPELKLKRPQIYFGELTNTDVYVKTRRQEFDYPQGDANALSTYEGTGGIPVGGFVRRVLLAFDRGDLAKLPFSDDITPESRLLMRRNIRDRVETLAPFLRYDRDPYIILGEDGRLYWMLDAFTVSDAYPYATHYGFGNEQINYIRNSVKVVIDAYDGTTSFYVYDASDPILAAYRTIFPTLFKDASAMPEGLRKHIRYPERIFKLQAAVYGLYHMTNPEVFYNREDLWTVANQVSLDQNGQQNTESMQPNYVLMKLPGESAAEFVEILPFTPANRNNLIGWIAGRSDGANYGKAIVYNFPKTRLVDGPLQIEARIDQNAQLSGQLTLWNQQGSHVRRGNLLVIPSGKALLYAEPIYLQAERSPMPELRLVVLALQDKLAYGPNFQAALTALFGEGASSLTAPETGAQPPSADNGGAAAATVPAPAAAGDTHALIAQAARDFDEYQRLTSAGKLAEAGQKLADLKRVLGELNARK